MTDPDQDLLLFVAAQELVLAQHAAALLEISDGDAGERLELVRRQRLVSRVRLRSQLPAGYRSTTDGSTQVDPALPPLRALGPGKYRHEIAIGWLWVAARHGSLGECREVLTRRQMLVADMTSRSETVLHTAGATFRDQPTPGAQRDPRHAYPALGLVQPSGGWVTVDVVLTPRDPRRLLTTLSRAQRDPRLLAQLFLVEPDQQIDTLINATAG